MNKKRYGNFMITFWLLHPFFTFSDFQETMEKDVSQISQELGHMPFYDNTVPTDIGDIFHFQATVGK